MTTTATARIDLTASPDRTAALGDRKATRPAPTVLDLPGPEDDGQLVEARASAFVRELGAPGELGRLLARRAAVLSIRMDRSAERDLVMVAALADNAREEFDAAHRADRGGWVAALRGSDRREVAAALDNLCLSPQGLDHLIASWTGLHAAIQSADDATAAVARDRAALWLDAMGEDASSGGLAERVAAQVATLRDRAGRTRAALAGVMAQARHDAGVAASFDPSPEAKLARRHEAAAERGFFRALHLIRALRRDSGAAAIESARVEAHAPIPDVPASPTRAAGSLGSFPTAGFVDLPITLGRPASTASTARPARPDLRKVAANRR